MSYYSSGTIGSSPIPGTTVTHSRSGPSDLEDYETPKERHAIVRTGGVQLTTWFGKFIFSAGFDCFSGCVVLLNFFIMTIETNARAVNDEQVINFALTANVIMLGFYTFESCSRLYLLKLRYFTLPWNVLDFVIVLTGLLGEALQVFQAAVEPEFEAVSALKLLRMLRLLRVIRLLVAFRELYVLVVGLWRCMRTLFWAALLMMLVLNAWSILSVELLHPLVQEMDEKEFGTCSWCKTAFSNVFLANLTWFQIVSGDGWSDLARPLIEKYGWPAILFMSSILIIAWGILNIIVAAIVDANMTAREDDLAAAAKLASKEHDDAMADFRRLCVAMDLDRSGDITMEEFKTAWHESDEFRHHLLTMGVSDREIEHLMLVMDNDGSGSLQYEEFIQEFTHMKNLVLKTTLYYLLRHAEANARDMRSQKLLLKDVIERQDELDAKMNNRQATERRILNGDDKWRVTGWGRQAVTRSDSDSWRAKAWRREISSTDASVYSAVRTKTLRGGSQDLQCVKTGCTEAPVLREASMDFSDAREVVDDEPLRTSPKNVGEHKPPKDKSEAEAETKARDSPQGANDTSQPLVGRIRPDASVWQRWRDEPLPQGGPFAMQRKPDFPSGWPTATPRIFGAGTFDEVAVIDATV